MWSCGDGPIRRVRLSRAAMRPVESCAYYLKGLNYALSQRLDLPGFTHALAIAGTRRSGRSSVPEADYSCRPTGLTRWSGVLRAHVHALRCWRRGL